MIEAKFFNTFEEANKLIHADQQGDTDVSGLNSDAAYTAAVVLTDGSVKFVVVQRSNMHMDNLLSYVNEGGYVDNEYYAHESDRIFKIL